MGLIQTADAYPEQIEGYNGWTNDNDSIIQCNEEENKNNQFSIFREVNFDELSDDCEPIKIKCQGNYAPHSCRMLKKNYFINHYY